MAVLLHELWLGPGEEETFCLAGPMGDEARATMRPGAKLAWTVEADSHFEAMTKYYEFERRGPYTTVHEWDYRPYPDTWLELQRSRPHTEPSSTASTMRAADFDLQTDVSNVYWELEPTEDPLDAEHHSLREDLIQITFNNDVTVDVGWLPSFSPDGSFTILAIKARRWDAPLLEAHCRTLAELRTLFADFLAYARTFGKQAPSNSPSG